MRIALGSDHAGYEQKEQIKRHLTGNGHEVVDVGTSSADESVDYPDFAFDVGRTVVSGEAELGVLVCGTGVGMSIAANKVDGVRAANITDVEFAGLSRAHNNANVIAVSGRFVPLETNMQIIDAFLSTPFEGGRHGRRVNKIGNAERT
jgi:ribose 5-phosphate isomerase B